MHKMNIKVLIVEDEMLVAENLSDFMKECGFHVCGIAISEDECFTAIHAERPDIVIMDINLKGKSDGIEIAQKLNQSNRIPFIFLTANSDPLTISRAVPLAPAAFISKPFNKNDLKVSIELACQRHNTMAIRAAAYDNIDYSVFLKEGGVYKRIDIQSILYIEAKGSYSVIVTALKPYTLSYNLNYFSSQVKNPIFKKVHRSYIININKVEGFDSTSLIINRKTIPVSKQYQKEIMELFLKL